MENQEFVKLLQDYGDAFGDRKRFAALLKDYFPEQLLKVNLILYLFDMDIHTEIEKTQKLDNTFVFRYSNRLCNEHGISKQNANWAINLWCECYGETILGKTLEISEVELDNNIEGNETPSQVINTKEDEYDDKWRFEYDYEINDNGVTIVEYIAEQEDIIVVPSRIEGYPVVEIGKDAFKYCDKVYKILLPKGIVRISSYAFAYCGIEKMTLPKGLTYIGSGAFSNCPHLETITIPRNVETLDSWVFSDCWKLEKVVLAENLLKIRTGAFRDCRKLKHIDIPTGTVEIEDDVFAGTGLEKIRIPNSVTSYGYSLFSERRNNIFGDEFDLTKVTIYCNANSEASKYALKYGIRTVDFENYSEDRF